MTDPTLRVLTKTELRDDFLAHFERHQETQIVRYVDNGIFKTKPDHWVETWDDNKKRDVITDSRHCVATGGAVVGAFDDDVLVGFGNVEARRFGSSNQYVQLPYLHVSSDERGKGYGKLLFAACTEQARLLGATKLYLGTNPTIETQHFYDAVGCVAAAEIDPEIYSQEPLDIQLEFPL